MSQDNAEAGPRKAAIRAIATPRSKPGARIIMRCSGVAAIVLIARRRRHRNRRTTAMTTSKLQQWTDEQAIPSVALVSPQAGRQDP